jgi:transposase-like protein
MTFFSVADACRRLGIDAKTLRRWLTDAQLSLQSHPHDGRKKGVSSEHLRLLAHLHQLGSPATGAIAARSRRAASVAGSPACAARDALRFADPDRCLASLGG